MTKSQLWATAGKYASIVAGLCTLLEVQLKLLPERYSNIAVWVGIVGAVAGAVVAAHNQSLSKGHVSVPVGLARELLPGEVKERIGLIGELKR